MNLMVFGLLILAFIALVYLLYTRILLLHAWLPFLQSFNPSLKLCAVQRSKGRSCTLVFSGTRVDESLFRHRFGLAQPRAVIQPEGVAFFISPDPFKWFKPVLVRFDQVRSFGRVRDGNTEWIEIEFAGRDVRGWAHLPTSLAWPLRTHGIREGVPPYRFGSLDENSSRPGTSAAAVTYQRELQVSTWVAEALETLDGRDPVDAFNDVDALWSIVYAFHCDSAWTKAQPLLLDGASSYWLSAAIRDVMSRSDPTLLQDVGNLLRLVRARMDRALGTETPFHKEAGIAI